MPGREGLERDHGGRAVDPASPTGTGPLVGAEPETGRPIDDPATADRANPRWSDGDADLETQPLTNADGSPNVMPADHVELLVPDAADHGGTAQDQGARAIETEIGRDNIRQGLGGGAANPALSEGGEAGDGS